MDDLAEISRMIHRLEETGLTRRQIAEAANVGPSTITRLAAGDARDPSLRVVRAVKTAYRQHFPDADPLRRSDLQQRFAPGCQPRAGR